MKISKHAPNDWCHICGNKGNDTVDVWYPENAEHDKEDTKYIRICVNCAEKILAARHKEEDDGKVIVKDPRFWDCECKVDFIHHISEKKCSVCGHEEQDMPESRVNEILEYFGCKAEDLVTPIDIKKELLKKEIVRTVAAKGVWKKTTYPEVEEGDCGWEMGAHYALNQILGNPIPGIHLSKTIKFGCQDWVAMKR